MGISVVLGLVAVLVITVVTHMYRNSHKANLDVYTRETANLAVALLTNANFCDSALKTAGAFGTATTPPAGATPLVVVNPGANNPTGAVPIYSLAMPGNVPVVWINQAIDGYASATISDIRFSSSAPQTPPNFGRDLNPPNGTYDYTDVVGVTTTYDRYVGFVNIFFAVAGAANNTESNPRPVSIPMTLLVGRNAGDAATYQKVVLCSGNDSYAQLCWEMGGAIDPAQSNKCVHTIVDSVMSNATCGPATPGMDASACTAAGIPVGATTGTGPYPDTAYGCAPLYQFVGFTASSVPICKCTPICY